jgi:hypothetical protein
LRIEYEDPDGRWDHQAHPAFAGVFDASRSTRDRLVLTWSLERDWITPDVDLTRMHAAVASSAGRDPPGSRASAKSRQNFARPAAAATLGHRIGR